MHLRDGIDLPNEILSSIINNLASDNFDKTLLAALASCRLVSHVLCSLATPLFFSSIELTDRYPYHEMRTRLRKRLANLNQLLAIRSIAALVHSLTLRIGRGDSANGTMFSEIIHHLPHIRHFTVSGPFSSISRECASAIQDVCRSPNLRTLNLENISYFPTSVITSCPNVRHLTLYKIMEFQPENVNPADETSSEYSFYLDSLDIDAFSIRSLARVIPLFAKYLSQIKNLRCENLFRHQQTSENGWNIILLASQTLIMLDLTCDYYFFPDHLLEDNPFDLSQLPALRHIKIQLLVLAHNEHMLYFLNRLLSIQSSTSGIETIEITITWEDVTYDAHGENLFRPDIGWSALDETLTCDKLVCLKKVVLDLSVQTEKMEKIDDEKVRTLEFEKYLTIPFINALFPKFTANTQHTLEIRVKII